MHLWSEYTARRGSNEVASCIYNFVHTEYQILQPGEGRTLVLWADRCCGQNNNLMMIEMLMKHQREQYFTIVEQKFFTTGHSFNDCDRNFASMEKVLKKHTLIVPENTNFIIAKARVNNPFTFKWMQREIFLNFKPLTEFLLRPRTLQITKYTWFRMETQIPNTILSRESHHTV